MSGSSPAPAAPVGHEDRVVGAVLVLLGLVALREGWRLYRLRETLVAGAVVGDDTFPIIVGAGLTLLGGYAFVAGLPRVNVTLPRGRIRNQMLSAAASLVAYWLLAPWLGYTATTALVAVTLFRTMGEYRWAAALVLAGIVTGALYLMFRVWLLQPLPSGLLGG